MENFEKVKFILIGTVAVVGTSICLISILSMIFFKPQVITEPNIEIKQEKTIKYEDKTDERFESINKDIFIMKQRIIELQAEQDKHNSRIYKIERWLYPSSK